jgi:chromosome segregation ATPase
MVFHKRTLLHISGLVLLGLSLPVAAAITCCEINGKRSCGNPTPPQCLDKAKTEFSKGGTSKQVEAPLTAEQRAAREAEEAKKKEEERKAAEQARKDRALLDSYNSEKDFDAAFERAKADIEKNTEQATHRLEAAQKKKLKLEQEKEFYQKKPMPADLQSQIKDNESEIAAQKKALEEKDAKITEVRARFDADKARYRSLKGVK